MKKIIALLLTAVLTLAVVSCTEKTGPSADTAANTAQATEKATDAPATAAPATEAPATEAPATEAPATEAPVTEAPVTETPATEAPATEAPATEAPATEAPVTEAPVTEAPATEAPVTEAPVTEAPATEAPTEAVTEAPKTIPDNAYFYDRIYIVPPEYYTMQEFAGLPSGLREEYDPGLCFFNFSISAATPLQGEAASVAFVQSGQPGATILGYRSFKVDGYDVEQIDYEWATQPIVQSMVTVHLEDYNVIVLFAALTTIDNALEEYTAIIDTLGIAY